MVILLHEKLKAQINTSTSTPYPAYKYQSTINATGNSGFGEPDAFGTLLSAPSFSRLFAFLHPLGSSLKSFFGLWEDLF